MSSRDQGNDSLEKVMGFGGFGKKSKQFDLNAIFEETRRNAKERNKERNEKMEEESKAKSSNFIIPTAHNISKPAKSSSSKKQSDDDDDDSDDDDLIGPPLPPGMLPGGSGDKSAKKPAASSDDSDSEEEEEEEVDDFFTPSSHEIVLSHGVKPISAIAVEPSGARFITGGQDFDMKFWDFAGMDKSLQSFRELTPCECHQTVSLQFTCTGEHILVAAANSQAKIYDRDGYEVLECVKGDQYLNDMYNTAGHTAMLNDGCCHPKTRTEFMTCSNDGTIRTWDLRDEGKKCRTVRKCRDKAGRRTKPISCCYSKDGKTLAAACDDGSLMFWDERKKVSTTSVVRGAHTFGSDTSSIEYSNDRFSVCTRGGDDTVKLWDVRKLKDPVASACDLPNFFSVTNCTFSPNNKMLVTGVSVKKNDGKKGKLVFLDKTNLEVVNEIPLCDSSIIKTIWNPRINQLFASTSDGNVHVLYDVDKSVKGAKLCVVKRRKKINQAEIFVRRRIITPYSLPLYREERERSSRKQMEKDRKDHVKSHRPQPPLTGRGGAGGRLKAHGSTLASFVMKSIAKDTFDDTNPREAILRHAEAAQADPKYISHAYQDTQPETIFQDGDEDDEEDEDSHIIIGSNKKPESEGGEPSSKRTKL